jgi:hypothetical protein
MARPMLSAIQREQADAWMMQALELLGWPPDKDQFTPTEVVEILAKQDYAIGPATIPEFIRKGYIPDPGPTWSRVDLFLFMANLECRRRWAPMPSVHDVKKSPYRRAIERARAEGRPPLSVETTIEDTLLLLVECDDRGRREELYEVLRLRLEGFEE